MLEWLFEPLFKTMNCHGVEGNMTCYQEAFGISPIMIIMVGSFITILGIASFINKWKQRKGNNESNK